MNSQQIKKDNSYLYQKVELRKRHLPEKKTITVLDAFRGTGKIWNIIKEQTKKEIEIIGIEMKAIKDTIQMKGDNVKYLKILDLSEYDIIDLDAYGIPYRQMKVVFDNNTLKPGTVIFFTFIQSGYGRLNKYMLYELGYSRRMIDKISTLFNRNGFYKFKAYIGLHGIKKVTYVEKNKKYYGYFVVC